MVIFRGGEVWFKTGILDSGLIFIGVRWSGTGGFEMSSVVEVVSK